MKKIITLFPGQGSQSVGMIRELESEFSYIKVIFEKANDLLKYDLRKLCLEGPEDELKLTQNAQPAILMTSLAWNEVLKKELGIKPAASSGHSLGEYSSLVAASALTIEEAIPLVRKRGQLMQEAVPQGKGKMAAVLGLEDEKVKALCEQASQPNSLVSPANFNAPMQVVISGDAEAVDRAEKLANEPGPLKAKKVIPLKVSAPFHCALMKPVSEQFITYLERVNWKLLQFPVANNVDAKLRINDFSPILLMNQIDHPVLWTQCMRNLAKLAPDFFIELGPGKVLTGLAKRIVEIPTLSLESAQDLKKLQEVL